MSGQSNGVAARSSHLNYFPSQRNVELQNSARAVHEENRRLREENKALHSLLQTQFGLGKTEIEHALFRGGCSGDAMTASSAPCARSCVSTRDEALPPQPPVHLAALPDPSFDFMELSSWSNFQLPTVDSPLSLPPSISLDPLQSLCCSIAEPVSLPAISQPLSSDIFQMQQSTSGSAPATPCRLAFRFLSDLNERRSVKMDLFEVALFGLWTGFRSTANAAEGCAVDNQMLFSVAIKLLSA